MHRFVFAGTGAASIWPGLSGFTRKCFRSMVSAFRSGSPTLKILSVYLTSTSLALRGGKDDRSDMSVAKPETASRHIRLSDIRHSDAFLGYLLMISGCTFSSGANNKDNLTEVIARTFGRDSEVQPRKLHYSSLVSNLK